MNANLTAENQQFIEQAIAEGLFASHDDAVNKAVDLLRDENQSNGQTNNGRSTEGHSRRSKKSIEKWCADFEAWAASHKGVTHFVDDSRESIYQGCGE